MLARELAFETEGELLRIALAEVRQAADHGIRINAAVEILMRVRM